MSRATHSLWRAVASAAGGWGSPRPGLRALCYHSVGPARPGDPYGLAVAPEDFRAQAGSLASGRWGRPTTLGAARLDGSPEVALVFDDGFADTLLEAAPVLAGAGLPFTACVTPGLLDSGPPYLDWPRLRELARAPGAEIGAHGLTHARLDALSDAELESELTRSRLRLEDALGRPVTSMTWPHGSCSRRTAAAARRAGFLRAGCSLYGVNEPGRDPLLLKRVEITGFDSFSDFEGKLAGRWDWFALRQGDPARR